MLCCWDLVGQLRERLVVIMWGYMCVVRVCSWVGVGILGGGTMWLVMGVGILGGGTMWLVVGVGMLVRGLCGWLWVLAFWLGDYVGGCVCWKFDYLGFMCAFCVLLVGWVDVCRLCGGYVCVSCVCW